MSSTKSQLHFLGLYYHQEEFHQTTRKLKRFMMLPYQRQPRKVRSLLGMTNYCVKFIPNFSSITKPLRDLTKKDIPFRWGEQHTKALNKVKDLLTSDTIMAYFDKNKSTKLTTDALPWGLSAILSQCSRQDDRQIVAYASWSLSPVEQRYSQTEKEALAIVWAADRFTHTCMVAISHCTQIVNQLS